MASSLKLQTMTSLSTSALAALEEMLQNTARSAPVDFMPIYLFRGLEGEQVIGHLNPEFIPYLQDSLKQESIPLVSIRNDCIAIQFARPKELSASL